MNGQIERYRASWCLGDVTGKGKSPPWEITQAADAKMAEVNLQRNTQPTSPTLTVSEFFETIYLPWITRQRRPSTAAAVRYQWNVHLKPVIGSKTLLRDVKTANAQRWLDQIAVNRWKRRTGSVSRCQGLEELGPLAKNTLKHLKSTLSGGFKHAMQLEYYSYPSNPMQQTTIPPETLAPAETHASDLDELMTLLAILPEPANTAVAIVGFAGLRRGEIEGLSWEDLHDGALWVSRSMWNGRKNQPNTAKSKAPVPIIPQLNLRLAMHRTRCGEPTSGPMFANLDGNRASLQNMLHRLILPVLKRCKECKKQPGKAHVAETHKYLRDDSVPDWRGWHAFRRGLATNLHGLGVPDILIQQILRHSNVATTQACYIKPPSKEVSDAMDRLAQKLTPKTRDRELQDSYRTVNPASDAKAESVN